MIELLHQMLLISILYIRFGFNLEFHSFKPILLLFHLHSCDRAFSLFNSEFHFLSLFNEGSQLFGVVINVGISLINVIPYFLVLLRYDPFELPNLAFRVRVSFFCPLNVSLDPSGFIILIVNILFLSL